MSFVYSVTSNDLDLLASANGTDEWRLGESRELSNVVRGVLEMTQASRVVAARFIDSHFVTKKYSFAKHFLNKLIIQRSLVMMTIPTASLNRSIIRYKHRCLLSRGFDPISPLRCSNTSITWEANLSPVQNELQLLDEIIILTHNIIINCRYYCYFIISIAS